MDEGALRALLLERKVLADRMAEIDRRIISFLDGPSVAAPRQSPAPVTQSSAPPPQSPAPPAKAEAGPVEATFETIEAALLEIVRQNPGPFDMFGWAKEIYGVNNTASRGRLSRLLGELVRKGLIRRTRRGSFEVVEE